VAAVLAAGLGTFSSAQTSPQNTPAESTGDSRTTPAPALTGVVGIDAPATEEDTHGDLPQLPAFLGGPRTSMAITPELGASNYLGGGVSVGAGYDDNVFLFPAGAETDTSFSVFPNLAIEQTTPRTRLTLGYAGGLTVNQRLSQRDQGSHVLNFDSRFRL